MLPVLLALVVLAAACAPPGTPAHPFRSPLVSAGHATPPPPRWYVPAKRKCPPSVDIITAQVQVGPRVAMSGPLAAQVAMNASAFNARMTVHCLRDHKRIKTWTGPARWGGELPASFLGDIENGSGGGGTINWLDGKVKTCAIRVNINDKDPDGQTLLEFCRSATRVKILVTGNHGVQNLAGLSKKDAAALIGAAGGKRSGKPWARLVREVAGTGDITGDEVRKLLNRHRRALGIGKKARTTRQAVNRRPQRAWERLRRWEKKLWREYLQRYGKSADVTDGSRTDLFITDSVRLSMALRMSPRHMRPGARDAAAALFNDPMFIGATTIGITVYFALWVAPEPLFSKATAVLTTIGLVSMAGFTAAEIVTLARAWIRLRDATAKARTLGDLERAAEVFGRSMGGSGVRILVALAAMLGSKAIPPRPAGGLEVASFAGAGTRGGVAAIAGAARPGWGVKVAGNGAVVVVPNAVAMAALPNRGGGRGGGGSARGGGSGGKAGPGRWQRIKESMSPRAAKYQRQVTGRPVDEAYMVGKVRFDGYKNGKLIDAPDALLEAKGQGYKNFVKDGKFAKWFRKGETQLLKQAQRQYDAARVQGTPIEWHVAEAEVIPVLRALFNDEGIRGIKLIHTPYKP